MLPKYKNIQLQRTKPNPSNPPVRRDLHRKIIAGPKCPDTKSIGSRIAEFIKYLLEELLSPTKLAVSRDRFHLSRKDIRKGYLFMCLISNQHINI